MKKILLISEAGKRRSNYVNTLPPLGILYLDAVAQKNGFESGVIDANCGAYDISVVGKYDIIGFSLSCSNVAASFEKIARIKREYPGKICIVGGPQCAAYASDYIRNPDIDAVFVGESETSFLEYISGKPLGEIKGVYYRDLFSGAVRFNGPRGTVEDINSLPVPSYRKLDLGKYAHYPRRSAPMAGIMTSRGCPYKCVFCFHTMGYQWRGRSAGNVADEIEYLVRDRKVKEICIYDDNFTYDKARVAEISREIRKRKVKAYFQLPNGIRADCCDEETIRCLKEMGVWLTGVAPESGDAVSLRKIQKNFTLAKVAEVVALCKKYGITTYAFYMLGFPWDTGDSLKNTLSFALELDTDLAQFSKTTVFPGTELFASLKDAEKHLSPYKELGLFAGTASVGNDGGLCSSEVDAWIRRCYRAFYLRPRKIVSLMNTLRMADLFKLGRYAMRTGNI